MILLQDILSDQQDTSLEKSSIKNINILKYVKYKKKRKADEPLKFGNLYSWRFKMLVFYISFTEGCTIFKKKNI